MSIRRPPSSAPLAVCAAQHEPITYRGADCPVCAASGRVTALLARQAALCQSCRLRAGQRVPEAGDGDGRRGKA